MSFDIDWSWGGQDQTTGWHVPPTFSPVMDDTVEFVLAQDLLVDVFWIMDNVGSFFPGASFGFDVLHGEAEGEKLLALRVVNGLSAADFRKCKRGFRDAMRKGGHDRLYSLLSILQRVETADARTVFSLYSTVP
ncbi:MAG TPA: hypothetical protein PL033_16640 [Candidatus Brocadiia bacterium]|nr:hypothetical protein [Candidatus Brocadiia bacterium]